MCLAVRYKDGGLPKPIRAKKDIHVIKGLENRFGIMCSPFRGADYPINQLVTTERLGISHSHEEHNGDEAKVSQGLHSFGSLTAFKSCVNKMFASRMIPCHAIIPKGALYLKGNFEGTQNCYVSTELLVTGPVKDY
jgi:hypothetical protein